MIGALRLEAKKKKKGSTVHGSTVREKNENPKYK
jgi:hypothetical protein